MAGKRKPWDKIPEESSRAFMAFTAYRDLGPERSLTDAATETGKARRTLAEWSTKYGWVSRAEMWDRRVDQKRTRAELTAIERMQQRHCELAKRLQDVAGMELEILARQASKRLDRLSEVDGDPVETESPQNIARTLEQATKIERLARGQATERTESSNYDLSKLSVDELKSLRDIRRKLGGPIAEDEDE